MLASLSGTVILWRTGGECMSIQPDAEVLEAAPPVLVEYGYVGPDDCGRSMRCSSGLI